MCVLSAIIVTRTEVSSYLFTVIPVVVFSSEPATTAIYTLSLHDALPIWFALDADSATAEVKFQWRIQFEGERTGDRKSTRLNSSHMSISYAVFCLKKKNTHASDHVLWKIRVKLAKLSVRNNRRSQRAPEY